MSGKHRGTLGAGSMSMNRTAVLALLGSLIAAEPTPAAACAPAPPPGEEVRIAEEEAIILWDPAAKVEHFIRRAQFRSTARSFGFLVPTPTTPTLGEVSASAFASLEHQSRPEVRYVRERQPRLACLAIEVLLSKGAAPETSAAPGAVRVIATAHVAGFDASTVEADDAGALAAWLDAHGFAKTPALTAWLERYVSQKWKITAFVVATDQGDPSRQYEVATRAVRMTFHTDRPFYPYREPGAERSEGSSQAPAGMPEIDPGSRFLRVHFLSTERHAATLAGAPWSARVPFAAPLRVQAPPGPAVPELGGLGDHLTFATVFVDESYPRRGIDEVYFAPSADRAEVRPPVQVVRVPDELLIPLDLILLVGVVVLLVVVRRRRKQRRAETVGRLR